MGDFAPSGIILEGRQREMRGDDMVRSSNGRIPDNIPGDFPVALGVTLRNRREQLRPSITQKVLADRLGYTDNYISLIENGKLLPSWTKLTRICKELDTNFLEMLTQTLLTLSSRKVLRVDEVKAVETLSRLWEGVFRNVDDREDR